MRNIIFGSLILACVLMTIKTGYAGAWTQKKGAYYVKFSLNYFSTKEQFSLAGVKQPLNSQFSNLADSEFKDRNFSIYAEYGVTDWFTAIATAPFKSYSSTGFNLTDQLDFNNNVTGAGDLFVGGRLRLIADPFKVSLQSMVKLPTGSNESQIPFGTGNADYEIRLQFGANLPLPIQNYFTADAGYTVRGGQLFNNEVPYYAEFGVFPFHKLILKTTLDGRKSVETISSQAGVIGQSNESMLIADQDLTRLGGGIIYSAAPTIQLSLEYSTIISGKNTLAGRTVTLGIAFTPF